MKPSFPCLDLKGLGDPVSLRVAHSLLNLDAGNPDPSTSFGAVCRQRWESLPLCHSSKRQFSPRKVRFSSKALKLGRRQKEALSFWLEEIAPEGFLGAGYVPLKELKQKKKENWCCFRHVWWHLGHLFAWGIIYLRLHSL